MTAYVVRISDWRFRRVLFRSHLEGGADAGALLVADRDVLQVRVGAGEAPGLAAGLKVRRVDASGVVDRDVERLDDLPQLRRFAVLEQERQERVRVRLLQVGQGRCIRGVPRLRLTQIGRAHV